MAEELHLLLVEVTLRFLSKQSLLSETLQYFFHVMPMLLLRATIDQDVVQVAHHKDINHVPEHAVHESLEDRGGICHPEWHHQELKAPLASPDAGLGDVTWPNLDLVVAGPQIQGGEVGGTL
jgi:hypothetical protein